MSWHLNLTAVDTIVVEDQLSAIRASDYLTSVALLGTNLNEERAYEIRKQTKGNVYLALDNDAWDKAVRYAVRWRSILRLRLLRLTKDIKDLSDKELELFMNEHIESRTA